MSEILQAGKVLDNHIRLESFIGRGGQGEVWRVKEVTPEGRELAAKLYPASFADRSEISRHTIENEIRKLSMIISQYVVFMVYAIYDLDQEANELVIGYTMPLASGETLATNENYRTLIRSNQVRLISALHDISRGLSAIHGKGVVHGDLKPSNVLLFREDDTIYPKISDLGAAYFAIVEKSIAWDPRYAAPERFVGGKSAQARSDIYSLGLIFFELLAGKYAYGDLRSLEPEFWANIHRNKTPLWDLIPQKQKKLRGMIEVMLDKEPSKRLDIAQIVNYISEIEAETLEDTQGERLENVFFRETVLSGIQRFTSI